jgi:excinuclease UvrABC nuclease subunit
MNCIYCYIHNQRVLYVGKSVDVKRRHREHKTTKFECKTYFEKLAEQLGWENIELRILEQNIIRDLLSRKERDYYNLLRPTANERRPKLFEEDIEADKQQKRWDKQEQECLKAMKT